MNARARAPGGNAPNQIKTEESSKSLPSSAETIKSKLANNASDLDVQISSKTGKMLKPKSRKRVNTAEKRASHNAVERQRRETLNSRFLVSSRRRFDDGVSGRRADFE